MTRIRVTYDAANNITANDEIIWLADGQEIPGENGPEIDPFGLGYSGVNVRAVVQIEGADGKRRRSASPDYYVQPITDTSPPGALTISAVAISPSEVQVQWDTPTGNLSGVNLFWDQGSGETEISDVSSPYIITGLTANTLTTIYGVAYNPYASVTSNTVTATTDPIPNPIQPPAQIGASDWDAVDVGSGGTLNVTVLIEPDNGGGAFTNRYYRINGGSAVSTGLTGPGEFDITGLTDGVAVSVELGFANTAGTTWGTSKSRTPTLVSPGTVANQTAEFGALTRALAGGFMPVNNSGELVPLVSYNSLVSGSLGAYTPSIVNGRLVFNAVGCPNGAVLRCSHSGGTVDLTISSVADTYHIASQAEAEVVLGRTNPNAITAHITAGKKCRLRRGTTVFSGYGRFCKGKTFATNIVVEGEGTLLSTWQGALNFQCSNVTIQNLDIYQPSRSGRCIGFFGSRSNIIVQDNKIHGPYNDPTLNYPTDFAAPTGIDVTEQDGQWGISLTLRRNEIYDVYDVAKLRTTRAEPTSITENKIYRYGADCIKSGAFGAGLTAGFEYSRNLSYNRLKVSSAYPGPHGDMGVQFSGNGAGVMTGFVAVQNLIFNGGTSASSGSHGITGFEDNNNAPIILDEPVIVGNIIILGGQNPLSLRCDGGLIGNNVLVNQSETAGSTAPQIKLAPNSLGITRTKNLTIRNNITEGPIPSGTLITATNNLELGQNGATVSYASAFLASSLPATTPTAVVAQWASDDATKGASGATGISFTDPEDPTTWTIDPALLTV